MLPCNLPAALSFQTPFLAPNHHLEATKIALHGHWQNDVNEFYCIKSDRAGKSSHTFVGQHPTMQLCLGIVYYQWAPECRRHNGQHNFSPSRTRLSSDEWHCFSYSRTPNCRSFIFSHQPLLQTSTRIFLPQISIGNVVADRTNDNAADVAKTPSRPTPSIQLVSVMAMTVAKAFRTKQTATKASPMTYFELALVG